MRTFDLNQTKKDNSDSFKKKKKRKERLDDFGNPLDNGIYYNAKHGYRVRVYCEEHGKYKIKYAKSLIDAKNFFYLKPLDLNQTKNDNSDSFKKKNKRKERLDDFGNPLNDGIYYDAKHGYRVRVYCEEHGKYEERCYGFECSCIRRRSYKV